MQTKAKSNSIVTHKITDTGDIVITVLGAGPLPEPDEEGNVGKPRDAELVLHPALVHEANRLQAMRHGFLQRIVDAAALSRDSKTFKAAPPSAKLEAMKRIVEHLESGTEEWRLPVVRGEGPGLDSIVIAAVAEVLGKGPDEVKALVAAQADKRKVTPKAYLATLATSEKVAAVVARMRQRDVGVSGADLLDELNAEGEGDEGDGSDDEGREDQTAE